MNVCEGSFPDIHERLLSAKSGSSWIRRQSLVCSPESVAQLQLNEGGDHEVTSQSIGDQCPSITAIGKTAGQLLPLCYRCWQSMSPR